MTHGLETIDHTVQLTHAWINELDRRLGWGNSGRSYQLLKVVLQAIRDWLPATESAMFAAQLPMLIRGAYYEHWQPAKTPARRRSKADFLARVEASLGAGLPMPTETAVSVVLAFLSTKISAGEIEDIRASLPAELRAMWPDFPRST